MRNGKIIQIKGLSKSYDGKKLIENLSFSVAAGEVYGLLGAIGAGKSTTIECIPGNQFSDKIKVKKLCEKTTCLYRHPVAYEELLHKFGFSDKGNAFVNELSGGRKQKLFIVLFLIPNPWVVFFNKLTTGA